MPFSPRISEIAQRERFVRHAVAHRAVFAVAGEDGLARVPSQRRRGRQVTLLWSTRAEAEHWAPVVTVNPRVKQLPLAALLAEVLPALAGLERLVGPDWCADPAEAELDPVDLAERLRLRTLEAFVTRARLSRSVWLLEDASGPALLVSTTRADRFMLPCWSDRAQAALRREGPWAGMAISAVALEAYLGVTLPWLAERGWLVAPEHTEGPGALELAPDEMAARLAPRR
jgi:hypothetical protein